MQQRLVPAKLMFNYRRALLPSLLQAVVMTGLDLGRCSVTGCPKPTAPQLKRMRETRTLDGSRTTRLRDGSQTKVSNFQTTNYPPNVWRDELPEELEAMLLQFFVDTTADPPSGAVRETRNLEMEEHEWEEELYARYPVLLRRVAANNGALQTQHQPNRTLTTFQASLRAAVQLILDPLHSPLKYQNERRDFAQKQYARKLAVQEGRVPCYSSAEIAGLAAAKKEIRRTMTIELFDPSTYLIKPVTFATFKSVLLKHKLRYTRFSSPTLCPICRDGPIDEVVQPRENSVRIIVCRGGPSEAPQLPTLT